MNRREATVLKKYWLILSRYEKSELRKIPLNKKFKQLAALMASVEGLGWSKLLREEESDVRARWIRLKRDCGG